MIIATAGHVDHGKTALVHALTGVDTDRLAEEKRRGMTIDLGFAYHTLPGGQRLGFVDVPGHQRFVHTMLAGAAGVDFVLLVVAADDGVMPQTLEHLAILNLLGLTKGACVVTKCDKVTSSRIDAVCAEVAEVLAATSLAAAPVFPISTYDRSGVSSLKEHIAAVAESHRRDHVDGPLRFVIDRAFTVDGSGLVVTGTVLAGQVSIGDRLAVAPAGRSVRVRGLHAQNVALSTGVAGQRLGINIVGAAGDTSTASRGDWLVEADRCHQSLRLDAEISVLADETRPFGPRGSVLLHFGAAKTPARIRILDSDQIRPGETGFVHLALQHPVTAICGDRLVLRDRAATRTIGGGRVIDPMAPARKLRSPERLARLGAMALGRPNDVLKALLAGDDGGVDVTAFTRAWNLFDTEMHRLITEISAVQVGSDPGSVLVSSRRWRELGDKLQSTVKDWHAANPSAVGADIDMLHRKVAADFTQAQFRHLLKSTEAAGLIRLSASHAAIAGFRPVLQPDDAELWQHIRRLLATGGTMPPRVAELADRLQVPTAAIKQTLAAVARLGLVHQVAANRFYLPFGIRTLAEMAVALTKSTPRGGINVASFRDASGLGRNLVIEVLEYFDTCGLTRRDGDERVIIADVTSVFAVVSDDMDTPADDG